MLVPLVVQLMWKSPEWIINNGVGNIIVESFGGDRPSHKYTDDDWASDRRKADFGSMRSEQVETVFDSKGLGQHKQFPDKTFSSLTKKVVLWLVPPYSTHPFYGEVTSEHNQMVQAPHRHD